MTPDEQRTSTDTLTPGVRIHVLIGKTVDDQPGVRIDLELPDQTLTVATLSPSQALALYGLLYSAAWHLDEPAARHEMIELIARIRQSDSERCALLHRPPAGGKH